MARSHRGVAAQVLASVGLHPGQEMLLKQLWDRDGQTQSELAAALAVEAPTITKMVGRLAAAGFVERRPHKTDFRVNLVCLTTKGRRVEAKVNELWDDLGRRSVEGFTAAEVATFIDLLQRSAAGLGGVDPGCGPASDS